MRINARYNLSQLAVKINNEYRTIKPVNIRTQQPGGGGRQQSRRLTKVTRKVRLSHTNITELCITE